MGSVGAMVVVEGDPAPDAGLRLRSGLPGVQVEAFILQGPPEKLDEDVAETAPFAVHRDPGADPSQPICPGEGRELAALVSVHDRGRVEPVDGLVQRLDAEVGFQRVRDAPGQNLPGKPVHDGDQIEEATTHGQAQSAVTLAIPWSGEIWLSNSGSMGASTTSLVVNSAGAATTAEAELKPK